MSNTEILTKLRALHEELSAINDDRNLPANVDDQTIEALGQIVTDVGALLDHIKENPDEQAVVAQQHDLNDRVIQFETDHPRVANLLTQITDVLAMMGI